ncbi:MAG: C45 family peptidase [Chloroflexota bacterium]|nr:C45 family peptidase [Chloroflexota bacterium]
MTTTSADLRQELTADYRVFDLTGDHYTIGYQMGQTTEMRPVETWRDHETELAFARACADVVSQFHPALLDEFRGYAAAQGRAWEDVLSHFSNNLPEGSPGGCTTLARRLPGGHLLVARNHDFLYTRKERHLRRLSPTGYPATLSTQSGFIGSCYDGVSSYGLFVALHTVRARVAEQVSPGVPPYLVPRILLETCRTAREAVLQVQEMPHLFPFIYLVADPDEMFAVETYPDLVRVRRPADESRISIVVTNYYESPDMRPLQGRRDMTAQIERIRWVQDRIARDRVSNAADGWSWAQRLLRDHSLPMCHHQPNQATLWALVADLTARRVAYCLGAPCRNEFREWEWPSEAALGAIQFR